MARVKVVVENMPDQPTQRWLLQDTETGGHYVASGVNAMFSGWEVLVFPADADGNITDWTAVAGGRGLTHAEAVADLESLLAPR